MVYNISIRKQEVKKGKVDKSGVDYYSGYHQLSKELKPYKERF